MGMTMKFPLTVYAVAMSFRRTDGTTTTAARILVVSGDCPLTGEEALARGRREIEAEWDAPKVGKFGDHTFVGGAVSYTSLTREG